MTVRTGMTDEPLKAPPTADPDTGRKVLAALLRSRSLLGALSEMRNRVGDIFSLAVPGFSPTFVAGPEANKRVLVKDRHDLAWRTESDAVTKLLRHGVLVEDDERHDALRACMDPPLRKKHAIAELRGMRDEVEYVCGQWESGREYDMLVEMRKVSLLVLMRASFHWDFRPDMDALWKPIMRSIKFISPGLWLLFPSMPRPGFKKPLEQLDNYLYHMVRTRRQELTDRDEPADPSDLLGALIEGGLDDDLARDQLLTMLIAGHDTSTALLAWALYLLGAHPEALAKATEEVDRELRGQPLTADRLNSLQYVDAVSKEALRMYPPIHVGNRRAKHDIEVLGCPITGESRLMYSIYLAHRHPDYWDDPDDFKPERFGPDGPKREHLQYVPFGGGPRNCIGAQFAQVQSKVVLAHMLANFRLELTEQKVRPYMGATLEPRPGVRMRVSRR